MDQMKASANKIDIISETTSAILLLYRGQGFSKLFYGFNIEKGAKLCS